MTDPQPSQPAQPRNLPIAIQAACSNEGGPSAHQRAAFGISFGLPELEHLCCGQAVPKDLPQTEVFAAIMALQHALTIAPRGPYHLSLLLQGRSTAPMRQWLEERKRVQQETCKELLVYPGVILLASTSQKRSTHHALWLKIYQAIHERVMEGGEVDAIHLPEEEEIAGEKEAHQVLRGKARDLALAAVPTEEAGPKEPLPYLTKKGR